MKMTFIPWIFALIFIPILIIRFYFWVKKTGWRNLSLRYPLSKTKSEKVNSHLSYNRSNVGGVYERNSVFSAIIREGVIIRKPFPFSIIMPAIFIPWSDIECIHINCKLDGKPHSSFSKLTGKLSNYRFVNIKLSTLKEQIIIIRWKDRFKNFIPSDKLSKMGRNGAGP